MQVIPRNSCFDSYLNLPPIMMSPTHSVPALEKCGDQSHAQPPPPFWRNRACTNQARNLRSWLADAQTSLGNFLKQRAGTQLRSSRHGHSLEFDRKKGDKQNTEIRLPYKTNIFVLYQHHPDQNLGLGSCSLDPLAFTRPPANSWDVWPYCHLPANGQASKFFVAPQ